MQTVMPVRFKFASNAAYDDAPRAVMDNRRRRFDDFMALINRQCALIADICARRHGEPIVDERGQYVLPLELVAA